MKKKIKDYCKDCNYKSRYWNTPKGNPKDWCCVHSTFCDNAYSICLVQNTKNVSTNV